MCKMLTVYKDIQQDSIQVSSRTVLYWTIIPQHNHLMEMCKTLIVFKDIQQDSIQVSYRTVLYWAIIPQHKHLIEMCKTLTAYKDGIELFCNWLVYYLVVYLYRQLTSYTSPSSDYFEEL
jgi:hypothetical protein